MRRIVEACTEGSTEREMRIADKRERWKVHKQAYVEQLRSADTPVRRVSCADSLHNARTLVKDYRRMGSRVWTRFMTRNGGDQVWVYRALGAAFREAGAGPMAEDLCDAVDRLESLMRE